MLFLLATSRLMSIPRAPRERRAGGEPRGSRLWGLETFCSFLASAVGSWPVHPHLFLAFPVPGCNPLMDLYRATRFSAAFMLLGCLANPRLVSTGRRNQSRVCRQWTENTHKVLFLCTLEKQTAAGGFLAQKYPRLPLQQALCPKSSLSLCFLPEVRSQLSLQGLSTQGH